MTFPTQAQTVNICDRTQAIVDEILSRTSTEGDMCNSVLASEMASINGLPINSEGVSSLEPGDFDGLTGVTILSLTNTNLTELQTRVFRGLSSLAVLTVSENPLLTTLSPDVFSDVPNLGQLSLAINQLNILPAGIFSGLDLEFLHLQGNPGDFQFTVKFEPEVLEEDFDAAPVRLVLREGAPRSITVPLSITGPGGEFIASSPDSLTLAAGSTQSDTVTVIRGKGYFRLSQGELELGGSGQNYQGFKIVRGPPITVGGVPVRVKVFLEGALE